MTQDANSTLDLSPEVLDRALVHIAMQHAMQYPLERTASASVFAIPPGLDTDILKTQGALPNASTSDELEELIGKGEKAIFIPKESVLSPAMIARLLEELFAYVAVFMESKEE